MSLKAEGNVGKGVGLILLSAAMFALAGTSVKFVAEDLSTFSLVFWRNFLSFWLFLAWIWFMGFRDLRTARLDLHVIRSLFTYGALVTYFFAISKIPLANAVLLQSMGPVFVPVMAFLVFRRLSDRHVWTGVLIGFAGVAFIVKPTSMGLSLAEMSGVAAGAFGGAAALTIWAMSSSEPPMRQMFYFTLITLLMSLLPLPWTWQLPSAENFVALCALAVCTTLAQYFLAAGFAIAPADKVNTWSYASVALAAIIGYLGWGESFGLISGLGILLVVIGAHLTTRSPKPLARSAE